MTDYQQAGIDAIAAADQRARRSQLAFLLGDTTYFEREVAVPAIDRIKEQYGQPDEQRPDATADAVPGAGGSARTDNANAGQGRGAADRT